MSYTDTLIALERELATTTNLPIAFENTSYKPKLEEAYARTTLLPNESIGGFTGKGGMDVYSGIFQVDLFYPVGAGAQDANREADKIVKHFNKVNSYLQEGPTCVRILNAWRSTPLQETDWYNLPVVLRWEYWD